MKACSPKWTNSSPRALMKKWVRNSFLRIKWSVSRRIRNIYTHNALLRPLNWKKCNIGEKWSWDKKSHLKRKWQVRGCRISCRIDNNYSDCSHNKSKDIMNSIQDNQIDWRICDNLMRNWRIMSSKICKI